MTLPEGDLTLPQASRVVTSTAEVDLPPTPVALEPPRLQWQRVLLEGLESLREPPIPQLELYTRLLTLPQGVFYSGAWPEVERERLLRLAEQGRAREQSVARLEAIWRQALTQRAAAE